MTKQARESVRQRLAAAMDYAGCGDTSCLLTRKRGGQATNGGCRCMDRPDGRVMFRQLARIARTDLPRALDAIDALEAENERRVREAEEAARRKAEAEAEAEAKRKADAEHAALCRAQAAEAIAQFIGEGPEAIVEAIVGGKIPRVSLRF